MSPTARLWLGWAESLPSIWVTMFPLRHGLVVKYTKWESCGIRVTTVRALSHNICLRTDVQKTLAGNDDKMSCRQWMAATDMLATDTDDAE